MSTIHHESLRLTKLLDEILDLQRAGARRAAWENAPVDADAVLDRAIGVCTPLAQQRKMRLSSASAPRQQWSMAMPTGSARC